MTSHFILPRAMLRRLPLAALLAALAGCASVTPDRGFDAVAHDTQARTGFTPQLAHDDADRRQVAATVNDILRQPLGADDAVRIAVLNNPRLQATYWDVGIAQADLAQASRLPNPSFDFKRTREGGEIGIERTFTMSLIGALTTPLATRLEAKRFRQVKLAVGAEIERQIAGTRRAWVEAVAARQAVDYARQVDKAAEASAELSARMAQAGNASKLDLAREQAFHAESSAAVARAERDAVNARERLARQLGLQDGQFSLPERLPDLPAAPADLRDIEQLALAQRLDVQAARQDAEATAAALGLTRTTRFINVLDLGYVRNTGAQTSAGHGYEVTLELPLFDWGGARVARAEATYMQSVNKVAEAAVNARSEAREAYQAYRSAYTLARHYRDDVIPLRKQISREVLLRYNGMLASTFELLADSREQAGAVNAYIQSLKDFWIAHATLEAALGTRLTDTNKGTHQ
ncbi:MAG: TolC family protein [Telluria sp.]